MPDSPATPDAGSADGFDLFGAQPTPAPSVAPVAGNPPVQPTPGPDAGTPPPPPTPDEPYDPRTDPRRFEYHQSRADKALSQLKEVEPYLPVVKYIQQNPHILEVVEADLSKQSAASTRVEAPKPPERPKKPEAYSKEEASSPGTASWQYHQDLLEYSANFADYQLQREQYMQYQQEQVRRQQTQQEQERQYLMSVAQQAQQQFGLSQEEVPGFLEYYTNPQYTTQQLVQLWRYNRNLQLRQQQAGPGPAPMGPPPVGVAPGASHRLPTAPGTPEQQFEGDFLGEYRRLRNGIPSNRPR